VLRRRIVRVAAPVTGRAVDLRVGSPLSGTGHRLVPEREQLVDSTLDIGDA
jgi:hypothetical protein